MLPMQVAFEDGHEDLDAMPGTEPESRFYTCHVCGDNWLSVKDVGDEGECIITFVHQMGTAPVLKRIAHMETPVLLKEHTVQSWTYFVDDQEITQEVWFDKLADRRRILRSICSN